MDGIVRELGGRKVIQFEIDPGEFTLFGCKLTGREYNKKWVYSLSTAKDSVSIGTVIRVDNGVGTVAQLQPEINTKIPGLVRGEPDMFKEEVLGLLKEILAVLKDKPVKEKKKTEEEEGVLTICGIKCRQDPNWDGKSRHRYVPTAKLDKDCSDAEFYAWSADHAKINGIELP